MPSPTLLYHEIVTSAEQDPWLVFIHGAGGSTVTWKRQVPEFQKNHNLLLVDLPGHGQMAQREPVAPSYSFDFIAQKIWEVIDHYQLKGVHLIGVSLGSVIGLTMLKQRPYMVLSMVNAGAIVRLNRKLKSLASASLALAKVIGYPAFYRLSARIMMPRRNHQKSRSIFVRESRVLTTEEFKKWTAMYYGLNKTLRELFNMPCEVPHLLVMGEQDHLFRAPAAEYAALHPKVSFELVESCGHVVSIEKAERFNRICLEHLRSLRTHLLR